MPFFINFPCLFKTPKHPMGGGGSLPCKRLYCKPSRSFDFEDFQRILSNTEGDAKFYIADLVKSNFTQNINRNLVAEYKNRSKCFSRVMSNADLIKFWFDDNSLKQDRLGPKNLTLIKSVIISFLGGDLKAIILEFFFAISNPPFKDSKRINRQKKELLE